MMVTSWIMNEMMWSPIYLLAFLSFLATLLIVLISYWNKINLFSRFSLVGEPMPKTLTHLTKSSASFEKVDVKKTVNEIVPSSEVVPLPLKIPRHRPRRKHALQVKKEKTAHSNPNERLHSPKQPFEQSPQPLKKVWYAIKRLSGQFRILIVDDNPTNLQVLENQLSLHNYIVTQAMSGEQALEMIYGGEQQFDLVIVDVMMPHISGYEVCRRVRQTFSADQLPVMMLTAKNQESDLVMGFQAGANDYLSKPFSKEELLTRIQTHLLLSKINQAYSRFVPHEFIEMLGQESVVDIQLGHQIQKEVTLLFSDIRSFTRLSEQMTPKDNFSFLNRYLERISPIIRAHKGFINQYIGDAIMALFSRSANDAIQAAIEMQHTVNEYNQQQIRNDSSMIHIGIGLHHDQVMLGIIGEQERMDTTIISPAIDIVMRLEELTKLYGASILISATTLRALPDSNDFEVRFVDKIKVKNSNQGLDIFEVLNGEPQEVMELKLKTRLDFEQGLTFYKQRAFAEALICFERVLETHPEDQAAWLYKQRVTRSIIRHNKLKQNRHFKHLQA